MTIRTSVLYVLESGRKCLWKPTAVTNAPAVENQRKHYIKERPVKEKYFLRVSGTEVWNEVSKERFIEVERNAGFHSKVAGEAATAYFSDGSVEGKVEYLTKDA